MALRRIAVTGALRRLARPTVSALPVGSVRAVSTRATTVLKAAAGFHCGGMPANGFTRYMSTEAPTVRKEDVVVEINSESFATEVMTAEVPVILDCYADWCNPCKQLTPILENIAVKAGGALKLAKLNTDHNQQLAQGLNITKLPTVIGVHQGKMVGSFEGVPTEENLDAFVEKLLSLGGTAAPETAERQFLKAQTALEQSDDPSAPNAASLRADAKKFFSSALELGNLTDSATEAQKLIAAASYAGLVRLAIVEGDLTTANQLADALRSAYSAFLKVPDVSRALAMLEVASTDGGEEADGELAAAVAADPDNLELRFSLAKQQLSLGHHESAIEHALKIVELDAAWNDDAGRTLLLTIFEALGNSHPLTASGRRKLSSLLFR